MINEVTKSVGAVTDAGDLCRKKESEVRAADQEMVICEDAVAQFGSLALEKQQYLLSADLYKCASQDSLSSLQQLVGKSASGSPPRKKFILEDHSTYTYGERSQSSQWLSTSSVSTPTNFLRPRMGFSGYQISGYKKYQIEVELKTVDLPLNGCSSLSPHLTGFLTICGLTSQHPEITTYFEGYAVTHKELGFLSSSWSEDSLMSSYKADDQTDLEHWLNFPAFKQLFLPEESGQGHPTLNDVIEGNCEFDDYLEQRFIFMRWKEKFLVPDALVDGIAGASYDGFYYIVHDQVTGNIQGFYYHRDAEKFQQLELIPSYRSLSNCTDCTYEFA